MMKQLNTLQTIVFLSGAVLMAVGAGCTLVLPAIAPWLYAVGALCFTSMQMLQRYEGTNFVVRRLRRMLLLSDLLFLVSAVLMVQQLTGWPRLPYYIYVQYVHNNWVVSLLLAAIIQLYATHRIDHELTREGKKI